jgi:ribosomal protein L7/L12
MTSEAKQEVEKLLLAGQKTRAVEYLVYTYKLSLQDAQLLVETLEAEIASTAQRAAAAGAPSTTLEGTMKAVVIRLLNKNKKMEAVKHVKNTLGTGFKEALFLVEEVARETNPNDVSSNATGCLRHIAKGLGIFFGLIALLLLIAVGLIYYFQAQSIRNSDLVPGRVTEMRQLEEGPSAPVIDYEWAGDKRSYASDTYSSPPEYQVGQSVTLYINREEPEDILINTFSDRYALLVGLGVIGAVFGAISIVFLYFASRKF